MKWNGTVSQPCPKRISMIASIAARLSSANATHAYSRRVPDSIHLSAGRATAATITRAARPAKA